MEKLTINKFIGLVDSDRAKEVYAKLLALRTEYEIDKTTAFNLEFFERCYHATTKIVEKTEFTKLQLCGCVFGIMKDLEQIGFTSQQLEKVANLYIE